MVWGAMHADDRALAAAAVYALVRGGKVAGLFDHAGGRHLRIAAEAQGEHLQGYDGDRDLRFGGTLPEVRAADGTALHLTLIDGGAQGFDRRTSAPFSARVGDRLVQLYDHADAAWYSYALQVA